MKIDPSSAGFWIHDLLNANLLAKQLWLRPSTFYLLNIGFSSYSRGQEQLVYEGYTYKKDSYQEKQVTTY